MCYIDSVKDRLDVVEAIQSFVRIGDCFTGYSIYEHLRDNGSELQHYEVSSYVRELFNKHHLVFKGYACVPLVEGPLMYFHFWASTDKASKYVIQIDQKLQALKEEQKEGEAEEADNEV